MAYPPGMELHGSTWRVKKRVPLDVRRKYPQHYPKDFLRLNTSESDKQKAAVKAWAWLGEKESEFHRVRETGNPHKQALPNEDADFIIRKAIHYRLTADEELRVAGLDDDQFAMLQESDAEAMQREQAAISRGALTPAAMDVAHEWLIGHGYDLPHDSPEFRAFAVKFHRRLSEATKVAQSRNLGQWVDTPPVPAPVPSKASKEETLLSHLVTRFLDKADQTRPMYRKYSAVLPLFLEVVGDKPIDQLKQIDIENFCHFICRLPPRWTDQVRQRKISVVQLGQEDHEKTISPKTYEDTYVASLRPFLNEAVRVFGDQGFPRHLTTDGIAYTGTAKQGENKQRPLTEKEIKKLFEGEYLAKARQSEVTEHEFWFPMVGLYSGARVNEVCQLNPQCDIREEEGVWVFDFTDEGEADDRVTKSVKNSTSRRMVPIHQKLLDLGFLKYVDRIRKTGAKLLFPQWTPSVGRASAGAREEFGKLLVKLGLRDDTPGKKVTGYHVFRSTMENRALNLEVENIRVIVGHAGNKTTVERGYEGQMAMETKKRILDRIWFDLDL